MPLSLNVPFYQRHEARREGAQWDAQNRAWYVADEDQEEFWRFEKWFPIRNPDLIIPGGPILIWSTLPCPRCKQNTTVFSLGTDGAYTKPSWPSSKEWIYDFEWGYILSIQEMDKQIQALLKRECPHFYKDKVDLHGGNYWINHCGHCGSQISDDLLYRFDHTGLFCPAVWGDTENIFIKNLELEYFTCYKADCDFYWDMYYLYMWVSDREYDTGLNNPNNT
jgi:hypothetical protein